MKRGNFKIKRSEINVGVMAARNQRAAALSGYQSMKSYVLRMLQRLKFSLARIYTIFGCFEQCRLRFISPTNKALLSEARSRNLQNTLKFMTKFSQYCCLTAMTFMGFSMCFLFGRTTASSLGAKSFF